MTYLLLYLPVCLISLLVYETCRSDNARTIMTRTIKNFVILTGVFVACGTVIYVINRWM